MALSDENAPLLVTQRHRYEGLIWMALSALSFSLMSLTVKLSAHRELLPSWEIVFFRAVVQLALSLVYLGSKKLHPFGPSGDRLTLLCRGVCGALGTACFFYGITQLSLADATVLFFTNPIMTIFLAWIFLGEPLMFSDFLVAFISLCGVALVARPKFLFGVHGSSDHTIVASVITLLGAVLAACAYIIVRKVGNRASFMTSIFSFGFVATIVSPIGLWLTQYDQCHWPAMRLSSWALVLSTGVFAFIGQCLLNKGLQLENAGPATVMRNLDVIFAFIFDYTVFSIGLDGLTVGGAFIIVLSTVYLATGRVMG